MRKNSGDEETLPDEQQGRRERFSSEDNPFDMEPSVVGKPRIDPVPRGSVEEASAGRRGSTPSGRRERNILLHGGGEEGGKSKLTSTLLMVVVFATLTGLLMGYDLCVIAVILEPVKKDFRLCGTAFTCFDKEMVVSLIAPGAVVGSFAGGCMTDKLGRRISIALSDVFIMLGCFLMAAAPVESLFTLLLGRIFIGVGVGIGFAVVAPYISEVSPTDRRGQLVLGIEISQCCGCLLAYGIATVISPTHGQWRSLMAAAGFVALVQGGGVFLLPESPRWLVAKGRTVEARAVILKVGLATDATADKQLKAMEKEMNVFNKSV
uniref:Major facilitator superfamily (MFS) profile domain-containing protein n=1 Tax=Chromera velia CCMP2878 TaxID=1169474 RepID=A0A0G4FFP0_9ALVE|eukprot:Cvel_16688.t1-p1 / transcript=Cvel_16688.t1 / gene=Cvel_16688 / organism=Chromera_velia_CCMP2878 / gene_product=Probable inositol transporter 2, putative / transcript_product=Probable inositol transporter 2, putative / location=Cvel_scaffold1296:3664-5672(+) / protein_length=320 / sequence_SO=supercontig / SO=protein_coding / is_pseudo=false